MRRASTLPGRARGVVHWVEPRTRHVYPLRYEAYRRAVPAWWPRLRPWRTGERNSPGAR